MYSNTSPLAWARMQYVWLPSVRSSARRRNCPSPHCPRRCRLCPELQRVNVSAVARLDKGLGETLTLHGLGLFPTLGMSLKTTSYPESLNAQLDPLADKMNHWHRLDQKQR
jgi:hypothetical protein